MICFVSTSFFLPHLVPFPLLFLPLSYSQAAYLASSLFLDPGSDLVILLVNTLCRDLASDNFLVASSALTALPSLAGADTAPALLPSVVSCLEHAQPLVRKKAVLALHRFVQIDAEAARKADEEAAKNSSSPSSSSDYVSFLSGTDVSRLLRAALCDKNPSVMAAALVGIGETINLEQGGPTPQLRALVPSLASILKQIAERRLPRAFDYHRVPAPWTQIRLLRLLARLCRGDRNASSQAWAVVGEAMVAAAGAGATAGHAVAAEAVKTAAAMAPHPPLLAAASRIVGGLLASPSRNLRWAGVDALGALVRGPAASASGSGGVSAVAEGHQLAVIDCLEDGDDSLRAATLDLLAAMASPANVGAITDKLVEFLASGPSSSSSTSGSLANAAADDDQRAAAALRARDLAERFAPSPAWFVDTMDRVFAAGGDAVPLSLAHDLARLVSEGGGDGDAAADDELRGTAAASALARLKGRKPLSAPQLVAAAAILGDHAGVVPGAPSAEEASEALLAVAARGSSGLNGGGGRSSGGGGASMPGLEEDSASAASSMGSASSSGWGFEKRRGKRGGAEEDRAGESQRGAGASSCGGGARTVLLAALVKLSLRTRNPPSPELVSLLRRASVAGSLDLASAASEALALLDPSSSAMLSADDGVAALREALSSSSSSASASSSSSAVVRAKLLAAASAAIDAEVGAALAAGGASYARPSEGGEGGSVFGDGGGHDLGALVAAASASAASPARAAHRPPSGLRFEAYAAPAAPGASSSAAAAAAAAASPRRQESPTTAAAAAVRPASEPEFVVRAPAGARKWGPTLAAPAPPQSAAAAAAPSTAAPTAASPRQQQQQQHYSAAVPPAPAVDEGKARLAASLFGGGGGSSSDAAGVRRSPGKVAGAAAAAAASPARPPVGGGGDLLGDLAAPPSPAASAGSIDLNALYGASPASPPSRSAATFGQAAHASPLPSGGVAASTDLLGGGGGDLMGGGGGGGDLLGGGGGVDPFAASAPRAQTPNSSSQPQQKAAASKPSDPFADLLG